jgi:hypothetical protein
MNRGLRRQRKWLLTQLSCVFSIDQSLDSSAKIVANGPDAFD